MRCRALVALFAVLLAAAAEAQAPVEYRLSFSEPEHRLMDVEVRFRDVPPGSLELRMSRSSPGRYALHEFAKNVFDVRITDGSGAALVVERPDPHEWSVHGHQGAVTVRYRIFGDRVDGTYLGIDGTHAHINMPAALMWARGLAERPATVRFEPPAGSGWRVGTQLLPTGDPYTYTAPNLQYLMDSPTEVSAFSVRTFTLADAAGSPQVRLVVHHTGTDAELDGFAADVERVVRETRHVFGEYPAFEGDTYTFIADYLPWASGDGMEHRNSTIVTSARSIRSGRVALLDTIAHEFVHAWNVERIRPRSLEPFSFEEANMSGELWFAEGFTSYYGPLMLTRAGLLDPNDFAAETASVLNDVQQAPGRLLRSAEEMSRMAPFVDAATSADRTSFTNTYLSYYTWGAAIGLALDLSLRGRSDGAITLDHFMQSMWRKFGKPGGTIPGVVDRPYTAADLEATLAEVAGDAAFAADFFRRYIQGHEMADYARLLARAGFVVRPAAPGRPYIGDVRLQDVQGRPRIASATLFGSPLYRAGLDRDDVILAAGGIDVTSADDLERVIRSRRPGDELPIVFERRGRRVSATLRLDADPRIEIVSHEQAGQALSPVQRRFRQAWLSSAAARNTF